jgi:hypothetical protein
MRFSSHRVAGSRDEDRLEIACHGHRWTIAVADGAGGISGGALAAHAATTSMVAAGAALDPGASCDRFRQLDRTIESDPRCGETTLVVVQIEAGELWGASVGDSGALLITPQDIVDLTEHQRRKPLLGSGVCHPSAIPHRPLVGRLLVATDGLLKYLPRAALRALALDGDLPAATAALLAAVTLPSGNLHDDVAVVLGERVLP